MSKCQSAAIVWQWNDGAHHVSLSVCVKVTQRAPSGNSEMSVWVMLQVCVVLSSTSHRLILCLVMCVHVLKDEMPPSAITLKQEKTDSKLRFKCVCRYVCLAAKCVSVETTCWKATVGFQRGILPLARHSATGVSHTVDRHDCSFSNRYCFIQGPRLLLKFGTMQVKVNLLKN